MHSSASVDVTRGKDVVALPHGARALSRWDFAAFEPIFAYYLELQKQLRIADLDEREVRGRWKSFVGRWNRGELAEGWYEPEMFLRVVRARSLDEPETAAEPDEASRQVMTPPTTGMSMADLVMETAAAAANGPRTAVGGEAKRAVDDEEEDDDWGPSLPAPAGHPHAGPRPGDANPASARSGPAIPTLQDLELQRTLEAEAQQGRIADLRLARKDDRRKQAEQLDELVPRAEPGTRERQLEKKRAVADKMREIRGAAGGGDGLEEVGEGELMGGAEDGAGDYRRVLESMQRRKTERELRREEFTRAKNAERDERIREYREREEGTVEMLKELARQRFG